MRVKLFFNQTSRFSLVRKSTTERFEQILDALLDSKWVDSVKHLSGIYYLNEQSVY